MSTIKNPEYIVRFATEIVLSWNNKKSNYIVVAPPLSEANRLFQLLTNKTFQTQTLGNSANNLAIAKIGQSDFMEHTKLVKAVLRGWGLSNIVSIDPDYPLGALELALVEINKRNALPVILVDRFHDAIKWLDGDFGIVLRDLEHEHFLKTVVSVPVTLQELRQRPRSELGGSPFLQSDWGTGHKEKQLKGYSESEVAALLKERGYGVDFATLLYSSTAGLPGLIDRLIDQIDNKNLASFRHYLRAESSSLCHHLLDYIDAEGEDTYQRIVAELVNNREAQIGGTTLNDHSWAKILLRSDGTFSCWMLGWAALDRLALKRNPAFIKMIANHARSHKYAEAESLLPVGRIANDVCADVWKALKTVIEFIRATDVCQATWAESAQCIQAINKMSSESSNAHILQVGKDLSRWSSLVGLMNRYFYSVKSSKELRLEEFVCQQKSHEAFIGYLQLHQLRLDLASSFDPLAAIKFVIEFPEALMQVFCYYKYEIEFWNYQAIDEVIIQRINELFSVIFKAPPKGQRMQFQALLWISHVKSETDESPTRIFNNLDELNALERHYKLRVKQVHSTSFVNEKDWHAYRQAYIELRDRVAMVVLGDTPVNFLPDPINSFCNLLNTLTPIKYSSLYVE